jgi:membrane protein YdbS with pleckstrin-like domain
MARHPRRVVRSVLERFGIAPRERKSRRPRLFYPPDEIVRGYLVGGERIIHVDRPAYDAFLVIEAQHVIVIALLVLLDLYLVAQGQLVAALVVFLLADLLALWLAARALQASYTRYVITTFRVMRVSGVLSRANVWIPWQKVTDLSFQQTWLGRVLGYATVRIESANEDSGLKDMKDLRDPLTFNRILVEMINLKQGNIEPQHAAVLD